VLISRVQAPESRVSSHRDMVKPKLAQPCGVPTVAFMPGC